MRVDDVAVQANIAKGVRVVQVDVDAANLQLCIVEQGLLKAALDDAILLFTDSTGLTRGNASEERAELVAGRWRDRSSC
ncbi:hypothetical protein [Sphingomonas aerolata]|uniref:hypothetical protein n=1 Tax=Sphingomonas aerolata TaxID=185951 RepID=UPI002FE0363A